MYDIIHFFCIFAVMKTLLLQLLILFFGISFCYGTENQDFPKEKYGVITVSVADARMEAKYSAEMGTQLLLGMPVQILKNDGWWQIKTPEDYVVWVEKSNFVRMTKEAFNQWVNAKKVIFTDDYGFAYEAPDEKKQRVSDLVFGNLLKLEGESKKFYYVSYPDGRKAYVSKKQATLYDKWKTSRKLTEKSIIETALTLKGIPYTWGGTSVKGMDCSGFTKTVFLKHGIILKRDAWQQAQTGIPVDISAGYDNLRPGDLMFFGRKATSETPERIRHVAIYMGNKEFIHAAGLVKINSLDPSKPNYDELNTREFLRATRIIGAVGSEGIQVIDDISLYRVQE